ncbi:aspartyl-phosphate phosphatase Spo0E family protein [Priestia megaterium]|jgi:stage 0 sporulation regulatory protein|uniref:aspartyl-phosphate phosphatase Spo0E family protein n=1 Tax=Priestia megaterium TaxID=1404 RepID=UPI0010AD58E8|nr:aspartyl-phosphate phosphatase Spo0E family protein [Priestia megaterium]MDH2364197.1 aspartyl-phosphate phosphatase Spo0E family protein [Priestia megaterium]MDQ0808275.1 stage 0 sporulation regulatory protein [Priestia megaterium]NGY81059.1 aspartyl-phosphate phosphatase Spo0E family protein [Priestia megaterium]TJZ32301.1 aspartyl-phosphate phosphatase Spo0E family protein [Priestia megaterium]
MLTKVSEVGQLIDLSECILNKRRELIDLGMNYGLLNKKTIQCSQDLDKLINLYMKKRISAHYFSLKAIYINNH